MIVGEPTLMGGEFGDEDERSITRLENTQYDASGNNISGPIMSLGGQTAAHLPNMSGPHMAMSLSTSMNSGANDSQYPLSGGPGGQDQQVPVFSTNSNNNNNNQSDSKATDMLPISSNLNGSLNNLLKSDSSRMNSCELGDYFSGCREGRCLISVCVCTGSQYSSGCNTPGKKIACSQQQQQQQQEPFTDEPPAPPSSAAAAAAAARSVKNGGPPRPTSQGTNQMPGYCRLQLL